MYCSKCGNQIADGSRFCSFCGSPVVEVQNFTQQIETPEPEAVDPEPVRKPDRKSTRLNSSH